MEVYEQLLNDKIVYVVDFDEMPELPIRGHNYFARLRYDWIIQMVGGRFALSSPKMDKSDHYAESLTLAIRNGIISEPGKYAIWMSDDLSRYEIYKVID